MALGTQVFLYQPGSPDSFEELTAGIGPGFGTASNKYSWSGVMYDGDGDGVDELYIGTWSVQPDIPGVLSAIVRGSGVQEASQISPDVLNLSLNDLATQFPAFLKSDGGEIWRYDFADESWTQTLGVSHPELNDRDPGIRKMTEFDGKLYAATGRPLNMSENPTKIFVSEDGENWTTITGGPLDPAENNNSIRTIEVVKDGNGEDVLLMGTTNFEGAQVWTYDSDGNWTKVATLPALVHAEVFISETGETYLGTWEPYKLYKLDLTQSFPANLQDVTPSNVSINDSGVMKVIYFEGYYYMGSVNYGEGASLFRTTDLNDRASWEVITTDGFETDGSGNELLDGEMAALGVRDSEYVWQMQVVDGALYVGDYNGRNGLVFKSENGTDWEILDQNYGDEDYGIRTLLSVGLDANGLPREGIDSNALIIGSADPYINFPGLDEFFPPPGGVTIGTPGRDVNLNGTNEEDFIIGLAGSDNIIAGMEDDIIFGDLALVESRAGNDYIDAGQGDDVVFADSGNDTVFGGSGQDLIAGGNGRDLIYGGDDIDLLIGDTVFDERVIGALELALGLVGIELDGLAEGASNASPFPALPDDIAESLSGFVDLLDNVTDSLVGEGLMEFLDNMSGSSNDTIYAEGGADVVVAGAGSDKVFGGAGRDVVFGGDGRDTVLGENDDDYIFGENGNDNIQGMAGNDVLSGGDGRDRLDGGSGDDFLAGDDGNDDLRGGIGQDTLDGGEGNDSMRGGSDADIFVIGTVSGNDRIRDFENGSDKIDLSALGVDAHAFAADLAAATSSYFWFSTEIDLDMLGGDGTLILSGVRESQIDPTDFII